MGKGGGCVPSKKKAPPAVDAGKSRNTPIPVDESDADATPIQETVSHPEPVEKLKIFLVFYSMYGHVEGLARRLKGVDGVDGVEGALYRVPETLPIEALHQMKTTPKDDGIPEITAAELSAADLLFGFPTRYGCMAAQMKAFFDTTGQLWKEQKLAGKPAVVKKLLRVFAGDGTREPSETELALAEHQGKYMAVVVMKLSRS